MFVTHFDHMPGVHVMASSWTRLFVNSDGLLLQPGLWSQQLLITTGDRTRSDCKQQEDARGKGPILSTHLLEDPCFEESS